MAVSPIYSAWTDRFYRIQPLDDGKLLTALAISMGLNPHLGAGVLLSNIIMIYSPTQTDQLEVMATRVFYGPCTTRALRALFPETMEDLTYLLARSRLQAHSATETIRRFWNSRVGRLVIAYYWYDALFCDVLGIDTPRALRQLVEAMGAVEQPSVTEVHVAGFVPPETAEAMLVYVLSVVSEAGAECFARLRGPQAFAVLHQGLTRYTSASAGDARDLINHAVNESVFDPPAKQAPPAPPMVKEAAAAHDPMDVDSEGAPQAYYCPITFELFVDPWIINGKSYEFARLMAHIVAHKRDPLGADLRNGFTMMPNTELRIAIEEWREKHGGGGKK